MWRFCLIGLLAMLLLNLSGANPPALSVPTVEVDGVAYGIGPARGLPIGNAQLMSAEWSEDGKAALIVYREFPNEPNAFARMVESYPDRMRARTVAGVWTRATNQFVRHAAVQGPTQIIVFARWLGNTRYVLTGVARLGADLQNPDKTVTLALPGQRPLFEFATDRERQLALAVNSETGVLAVVMSRGTLAGGIESELRIFDPSQGTWRSPRFWSGSNLLPDDMSWLDGTSQLVLSVKGIHGRQGFLGVYDHSNDSFTQVSQPELQERFLAAALGFKRAEPPLWVATSAVRVDGVLATRLRLEVRRAKPKEGEPKVATLDFALGARRPNTADTYDGVLFEQNGAILFADILRLDPAKMSLADPEARAELISRAKMVGLAVIMFAADNDGRYPTLGEFPDAIVPYLRDIAELEGFVYTNSFSREDQVDNPAEREMGHILARGGRVVVHMDTSTRWIPDR